MESKSCSNNRFFFIDNVPSPELEAVDEQQGSSEMKPLEKRAINFLVNEYLLYNDYKLSSVTFAEENEDQVGIELLLSIRWRLKYRINFQDFEDWDDVGLNTPKPPDLLRLYRDYRQHIAPGLNVVIGVIGFAHVSLTRLFQSFPQLMLPCKSTWTSKTALKVSFER